MALPLVILDTNVIVAGVRSRNGASAELLRRLVQNEFRIAISATLVFEYEEVLVRTAVPTFVSLNAVDALIRFICDRGVKFQPASRSLPSLIDLDDEFILDLAKEADVDYVVTHNVRHFTGGVNAVPVCAPGEFLRQLRKS